MIAADVGFRSGEPAIVLAASQLRYASRRWGTAPQWDDITLMVMKVKAE